MKSKTVKMLSAVVVLGVLSGTYVGVKNYVSTQEAKEEKEEDNSEDVTDISSDDVKSVAYTADQENVELDKDNDSWVKKGESDFPLNQDSVSSAVNNILKLTADQKITDVEDLSEYDLDSPQNEITITSDDGTQTVIQVGMENSSISQYYIKKSDDDKTVYLVADSTLSPFMSSLYDMAESETFPSVTTATITDVKVDKEDGYELTEDPDDLFWTVKDDKTSERADTSKAGDVTSAIGSLAYDKFVDYNCTDDSKYGFDDPYAVITAKYTEEETAENDADTDTADSSEESAESSEDNTDTEDSTDTSDNTDEEEKTITVDKEIVIYVGDETDGDRYVKVNDSNQVYTITEDSLSAILDSKTSDFYSLSVNYVSLNDLDSLDITTAEGDHKVTVTRETTKNDDDEETTTTTYSMDGSELDESAFTTFYNKLINMTAQERVEEEYKPENDPAYTFVFTKTDGTELTAEYYEYDTNFYMAVTDGKVYKINKMNVKELNDAYQTVTGSEAEEKEDEVTATPTPEE